VILNDFEGVQVTIQHRILQYLAQHPEGVDDDALTLALDLKHRQQANVRCRRLEKFGVVTRRRVDGKTRNFLKPDAVPIVTNLPDFGTEVAERPWFWEGHVQAAVVGYLRGAGFQIKSFADTASKQQGKDVIAVAPSGETLWISVKGYPVGTIKTNPHTQARHWFAHALFDLILWRGEDSSVSLALALPQKDTYRKLASRANWFLATTRNCIYWVDQEGTVTMENCR
jgi:hypothetical protein